MMTSNIVTTLFLLLLLVQLLQLLSTKRLLMVWGWGMREKQVNRNLNNEMEAGTRQGLRAEGLGRHTLVDRLQDTTKS